MCPRKETRTHEPIWGGSDGQAPPTSAQRGVQGDGDPGVPAGTATAKAIDYNLNRWTALTRYLQDPRLPIDNNHGEQQIRPWATGRKNWLFAGTLPAGQRAAVITSLIQTAKLNGHGPYAYLKDVLQRLPTQRASEIGQLLPHRWSPAT